MDPALPIPDAKHQVWWTWSSHPPVRVASWPIPDEICCFSLFPEWPSPLEALFRSGVPRFPDFLNQAPRRPRRPYSTRSLFSSDGTSRRTRKEMARGVPPTVCVVGEGVANSIAGLFVQQAATKQALPPLRSLRIPRCQARSRDHR